jgi:hypothetical protein
MANVETAPVQQVFDIAKRQRKTVADRHVQQTNLDGLIVEGLELRSTPDLNMTRQVERSVANLDPMRHTVSG